MLKNYFKVALRSLLRRKAFTAINIFGLSIGISFSLLIGCYIWLQYSVNMDLKNARNQYFILSEWKDPRMGPEITTFPLIGPFLVLNYPTLVAHYYRFDAVTATISNNINQFREEVQAGDSTMLTMFGFPLLNGDARTALNAPNAAVITDEIAKKVFGTTDVLGKPLYIDFNGTSQLFNITGVMKRPPRNSVTGFLDEEAQVFIPMNSLEGRKVNMDWTAPTVLTYLELKDGVKVQDVQNALRDLLKDNTPPQLYSNLQLKLSPLSGIYFDFSGGYIRKMVLTLSAIAFLILLMAIFNFVNVAIGSSSHRLTEIGLRKTLGGRRGQLIIQFLTEYTIIVLIATLFSLVFYQVFRNYFSHIFNRDLLSVFALPPFFYLSVVVGALVIGATAGIYPSLILSATNTVASLKGKTMSVTGSAFLRKAMIVFQFSLAIAVFIATLTISNQVNYMLNGNLGYNKSALLILTTPKDWTPEGFQRIETVRDELSRVNGVQSATVSFEVPDGNNGFNSPILKTGRDSSQAIPADILQADEDYADTYQLSMLAGPFFARHNEDFDHTKVVINETAAKALGWEDPSTAVGNQITIVGRNTFTVAGVIKDFHFGSMQERIPPIVFLNVRNNTLYRYITVRITGDNLTRTVDDLRKKWTEILPNAIFNYTFMDDVLQRIYSNELDLKNAGFAATLLSIIIVFLGIIGLIIMNIGRRNKEIAMRKVMGASSFNIILQFNKEFLSILLVSILISWPISWLLLNKWLDGYSYRIGLTFLPFLEITITIALLTFCLISLLTYNVSVSNPVKSIRAKE
jgi:putative ABC transport system permease protein